MTEMAGAAAAPMVLVVEDEETLLFTLAHNLKREGYSVLTAAQMNTYVRDNTNETGPAKVTAAGQYLVATGANTLAARQVGDEIVEDSETTTSTSYTDLATTGPSGTRTTGTTCLVTTTCELSNSGAGTSNATFAISGATTTSAEDFRRIKNTGTDALRMSVQTFMSVTAGSNTFTMKYRVSSGTGTFLARRIHVMPF